MHLKLVFLVAAVAVLIVCSPASADSSARIPDLERLLQHVSRVLNIFRTKRTCSGYMCSYSHTSNAAGKAAIHKTMMQYIFQCAQDKNCSPGKRRKRSLRAASRKMGLLDLTQYQLPARLMS